MADDCLKDLPKDWVRKESKSKPGRFYYSNKRTGVSVWKLEQVLAYGTENQAESGGKQSKANRPSPIVSQSIPAVPTCEGNERPAHKDNATHNTPATSQAGSFRNKVKLISSTHKNIKNDVKATPQSAPRVKIQYIGKPVIYKKQDNVIKEAKAGGDSSTKDCLYQATMGTRKKQKDDVSVRPSSAASALSKTTIDKKTEERESQFEKLIADSALKREHIDLETPIGTKHQRKTKTEKPYRPIFRSMPKASRYTPFPKNSKESLAAMKSSKSDTNLLLSKDRKVSATGKKLPTSPVSRNNDDRTPSSSSAKGKRHTRSVSDKSLYKSSSAHNLHRNTVSVSAPAPTTQTQLEVTLSTPSTRPVREVKTTPLVGAESNETRAHTHKVSLRAEKFRAFSTGGQTDTPTRARETGDLEEAQRVKSYSLEGDWDMLSDDGEDSSNIDGSNDSIDLVSFALNSDVVMACSPQDTLREDQPTRSLESSSLEPSVCLVVDTCSMGNLPKLLDVISFCISSSQELKSESLTVYTVANLVIPWQVLQELDCLKDNRHNKFSEAKARKAQRIAKLIHSELSHKNSLVKLQSPMDDARDMNSFTIQTPDDHIIKCGLSLQEKLGSPQRRVIVITEDINLINKCTACGLDAYKFTSLTPKSWKRRISSSRSAGLDKLVSGPRKAVVQPYMAENNRSEEQPAAPVEPVSVSQLAISRCTTRSSEEVKSNLAELEVILIPLLSKCLAMEMAEVFGNTWVEIVYKKPPWETVLPILESINKHWIAVFGLVVERHAQKFVKTLMEVYSKPHATSQCLADAIISATDLARVLGSSNRRYSHDARLAQPLLSRLLDSSCKEEIDQPAEQDGKMSNVAQQLTAIFTKLGVACNEVSDPMSAQEAQAIVMPLGVAYNSAMTPPASATSVEAFHTELLKLSKLMSIQVEFSSQDLQDFIESNTTLMLEGLGHLEHIALALHHQL